MVSYPPQDIADAYDILLVHGRKSVFILRETIGERRTILANIRSLLQSVTADQAEEHASNAVISIAIAKDELRTLELRDMHTLLDAEDVVWQSLLAPFAEREKIRRRLTLMHLKKKEAQKAKNEREFAKAETMIGFENAADMEKTNAIAQILDNIAELLKKEADFLKDSHMNTLAKMRASHVFVSTRKAA
jgi:hypothetical protein